MNKKRKIEQRNFNDNWNGYVGWYHEIWFSRLNGYVGVYYWPDELRYFIG